LVMRRRRIGEWERVEGKKERQGREEEGKE
jgi:hypothetical protein